MATDQRPTSGDEGWRDYLKAVRRKVEIAKYHMECLGDLSSYVTDIPMQAHLEGVLYCAVSASDQIAEAINREESLRLRGSRVNLTSVLDALAARQSRLRSPKLSDLIEALRDWSETPILVDARKLRNRATHHAYRKDTRGLSIEVQSVGSEYSGSRDVREYCKSLAEHLEQLEPFVRSVETALSASRE